jgi:2-oxoglutarate dehydrogenase E1 component
MQVCNPTTPAQMFHLLRRQMLRPYRKPLVIMSPKSTLRRKVSFSSLEDLATGGFNPVIGEPSDLDPQGVVRVILCSGKVFYELEEARRARDEKRVALIRIEQLYPFPDELLMSELRCHPNAKEIVWTQEEPMNQGAWDAIDEYIRGCMQPHQSLSYAGRLPSAAPAGGYYQKHMDREKRLIDAAFNLEWTDPHPIKVFQPYEAHIDMIRR